MTPDKPAKLVAEQERQCYSDTAPHKMFSAPETVKCAFVDSQDFYHDRMNALFALLICCVALFWKLA
jgi:hypothetical protein